LRSNKDASVPGAKISVTVSYPSGNRERFEGITDENGRYEKAWIPKEENRSPGRGEIILKVSTEHKTSSELIETFEVIQDSQT
jgi:hypothetical protein